MCINPTQLPNGQSVACRKCWQCAENRLNDWAGRCIAESKTATACEFLTLTYGQVDGSADHLRAAVLTYSDIQKFLKLLRRHGHPCRYLVAGELGEAKGRAHWHLIVFWTGEPPSYTSKTAKNGDELWYLKEWPHGHVDRDKVTYKTVRYVCKYVTKDESDPEAQGKVVVSKKPPLGQAYFRQLARRYVQDGLAPQSPSKKPFHPAKGMYYSFAGVNDKEGKRIQFWLRDVSLTDFLRTFVNEWTARRGRDVPNSDLVDWYCDSQVRLEEDFAPSAPRQYGLKPFIKPGFPILFSEPHNSYYYIDAAGIRWFWSVDEEGNPSWERKIRTEAGIERRKSLARREPKQPTYADMKAGLYQPPRIG